LIHARRLIEQEIQQAVSQSRDRRQVGTNDADTRQVDEQQIVARGQVMDRRQPLGLEKADVGEGQRWQSDSWVTLAGVDGRKLDPVVYDVGKGDAGARYIWQFLCVRAAKPSENKRQKSNPPDTLEPPAGHAISDTLLTHCSSL
jgi:hypothetical protein